MKAPSKITGFIAALIAVFALSFGAGAAVGPETAVPPAHGTDMHTTDTTPTGAVTEPAPAGHGH